MKIRLRVLSARHHCDQIVTGFLMLGRRKDGRYDVSVEYVRDHPFGRIPLAEAQVGDVRIVYDLEDSYWTTEQMGELLDGCDAYFKRSYSEEENGKRFTDARKKKIFPLGFNYSVQLSLGLTPSAFRLYGRRGLPRNAVTPAMTEAPPSDAPGRGVCFLARLWDPMKTREKYRDDYAEVSRMRVGIMRALRENVPGAYCGLQDEPYARKIAPDLILPDSATERRTYLKRMRESDVCVASTGLHGSIGGKFGEYIAASRAIVSEPLVYEVPGGYAEGKHYLVYRTPEECVEKVMGLLNDPDRIREMQRANRDYYERYLRPDVLVGNSLKKILGEDRS